MKEQDVSGLTKKVSKQYLPSISTDGLQSVSLSFAERAIDCVMQNRHLKEKVGSYANIESFILAIALKGKSIQKSALAKCWSIEACLFLPSIKSYELSKTEKGFTDEIAVKIFQDEIINVANFLEVQIPSEKSLEELSWNLYDNYYHWSLMDLMMCCQKIKNLEYKGEYQHISSRGITVEFLLDWFEKYDVERREKESEIVKEKQQISKSEFYREKSGVYKSENSIDLDIILKDILIKRNSKVIKKSKLKTLESEYKSKLKQTSQYIQLYDELYFLLGLYDQDHEKIDMICKNLISIKMQEWRSEFNLIDQKPKQQVNEDGRLEVTKDRFIVQDGKTIRVKSLSLKKFYNQKASSLKYKLSRDIETQYAIDPISIAFTKNNPGSNAGDVSYSTKKVINSIQDLYIKYVNDSIEKKEFPFSKNRFFYAKANMFAYKYAGLRHSDYIIKKYFDYVEKT